MTGEIGEAILRLRKELERAASEVDDERVSGRLRRAATILAAGSGRSTCDQHTVNAVRVAIQLAKQRPQLLGGGRDPLQDLGRLMPDVRPDLVGLGPDARRRDLRRSTDE